MINKIKNQEEQKDSNESNSYFVWLSLRVSFWVMVFLWLLIGIVIPEHEGLRFEDWIYIISIFFTFVVSIIHLVKFKEKALAVTALVISSIGLFFFLIGFLIGLAQMY